MMLKEEGTAFFRKRTQLTVDFERPQSNGREAKDVRLVVMLLPMQCPVCVQSLNPVEQKSEQVREVLIQEV